MTVPHKPPGYRRLWTAFAAICAAVLIQGWLPARADMMVSGAVSGTWRVADSPVRVVSDIWVGNGTSLVIEPGVSVTFVDNFSFDVHGLLTADGDPQGAGYITFSSQRQWSGITFHPDASASSRITFCNITDAWIGISIDRTSFLTIQQNSIRAYSIGISVIHSNPDISSNRAIVAHSDTTVLGDARAISLHDRAMPRIVNNSFISAETTTGGEAFGIWIDDCQPVIHDNWIQASSTNVGATAIYARNVTKVRIERNTIRAFSNQKMRGVWFVYSTGVALQSNDIFLYWSCTNAVGIIVGMGSRVTLVNNIVQGNGMSIGDSTTYGEVDAANSGYNDYFQHAQNHIGDWEGGNGEIHANPIFDRAGMEFDPGYYRLTANSPCKDAGHPEIQDPEDIYRTRSDIGRYPFIYNPNPVEVSKTLYPTVPALLSAFPNPFNRTVTVSFELALPGQAKLLLCDLTGRSIRTLFDGYQTVGSHNVKWSADGVAAGEYFVRLESASSPQTIRLIYLP